MRFWLLALLVVVVLVVCTQAIDAEKEQPSGKVKPTESRRARNDKGHHGSGKNRHDRDERRGRKLRRRNRVKCKSNSDCSEGETCKQSRNGVKKCIKARPFNKPRKSA